VRGTGVLRVVRTVVVAIALSVAAPSAVLAATNAGGLQQLPSPDDCVSTLGTSGCGTIVNGGLVQARSVAISPGGENAYVASQSGALSTFGRNNDTGALSYTSCVKDAGSGEVCPNNSPVPLSTAAWVVATDDNVYVASRGGDAISEFTRNPGTGTPTPLGCISETGANAVSGGPACAAAPGLKGVDRLALSSDETNLYAVSPTNSTLVALKIGSGGTLSAPAGSCLKGTASPESGCTSAPGLNGVNAVDVAADDLTVNASATSSSSVSYLTVFARGVNGTLGVAPTQCFHSVGAGSDPDRTTSPCNANPSPVPGLDGADGVRTSPDDNSVYVVSGASAPTLGNSLVTFNRNTTTGALSSNRCLRDNASSGEACGAGSIVKGLLGAFDIALTPDGEFLYVTGRGGNDVAEFKRNTGNGNLTQLLPNDQCIGGAGNTDCTNNNSAKGLGGAGGIALSPDGLFAYVAAPADNAVSEFSSERAPTCSDIGSIATPRNQPVTFTLPCSDPNRTDMLTCTIDAQPANGSVSQSSPGSCTVTYTPNNNYTGPDTFTYHATDPAGQDSSPVATAAVNVQAAGTPTVTISDAAVNEDAGTMTFQLTLSQPVATPVIVDYQTRDDTATAGSDYTATPTPPVTGTVTFSANQTLTTITVPINDDNVHESTERFFVDLTSSSSGTAIARPTATGTITDDDPASLTISDPTVNENAGFANFTVTLSNPAESTVRVTYDTANGSATAGSDFAQQSNKTISFAPGETSKQISVPITNDNVPEPTEQFSVTLSAPTGGASLGKATGTGTIQDEDNPTVSISDTAVQEGNSGTRNAIFTVSLSTAISRTATVNYATQDGTASSPSDYTGGTGTVTFNPGETSKTISIPVNGDTTPENDETFKVNLSGPSQATIGTGSGTGTILDDDTVVTQGGLAISDASVAEGDTSTHPATFSISLSEPSSHDVSVHWATADRTATVGDGDYLANQGDVTIPAGDTSRTVTVDVNGDTTNEADETFTVNLSNPSGAPISRGTGTGTIVNDDPAQVKPGLRLSVTPRDRKAPYRFTAKGSLVLPTSVSTGDGCNGSVRIIYESGGKTIANDLAGLDSNCKFKLSTVFENRRHIKNGRLIVHARFLGNRFLLAKSPAPKRVRAG
jgi:Calx-beta domain/Bacterial Ig domain